MRVRPCPCARRVEAATYCPNPDSFRFRVRWGLAARGRTSWRQPGVANRSGRETPEWTAVSDVGATEVRKYFSTFVTRPVYWFQRIVPGTLSEIRDVREAGHGGERRARSREAPSIEIPASAHWSAPIVAMMGCRDFGRGSRKLWPAEYGLRRGTTGHEGRGARMEDAIGIKVNRWR